jgi:hypothetical protein
MYQNKEVAMRSLRLRIFYACRLRSAAGCGTIKSGLKKDTAVLLAGKPGITKPGFFMPAYAGRQACT